MQTTVWAAISLSGRRQAAPGRIAQHVDVRTGRQEGLRPGHSAAHIADEVRLEVAGRRAPSGRRSRARRACRNQDDIAGLPPGSGQLTALGHQAHPGSY